MSDKTPTKAELFAEIQKVAAELGKPVPEGLANVQQHFDALEALTGKPDPRRPSVGGGAVRASQTPPAVSPSVAPSSPLPLAPVVDETPPAPPSPPSPPAPPAEGEQVPATWDEHQRFRVSEGKLVHCLCGPLGALQEIRAIDLGGGVDELAALLAEGTVEPTDR